MSKILITSGCSFSECLSDPNYLKTWPIHLFENLKSHGFVEHISKAMGSQGNGLISRGIIYQVTESLKKYDPEDILVGVMWSGSDRHDYRFNNTDEIHFINNKVRNGWIENPTKFITDAEKKWIILNANWSDAESCNTESNVYYKFFHDDLGHSIYSLEHILRVQLFLEKNNIKFFFSNYVDENIVPDHNARHVEISYLLDLIDKSKYLPVTSEHRWVFDNSKTKEQFKKDHFFNGRQASWIHPDTDQHKEFVDNVVYPWLLNKKYI